MTDLDTLRTLFKQLSKRDPNFCWADERKVAKSAELYSSNCTRRVLVLPGYRAHCEFEFDANGDLLAVGSFDEL